MSKTKKEVKEVTSIGKVILLMDAIRGFDTFKTEEISLSEMISIKNSVEEILKHRLK
jgi:hypothetical protein